MPADRSGASRLSPDGDLACVATESTDVLLHPVEGKTLISQSDVGVATAGDLLRGEQAPTCETVVDRDTDDGLANLHAVLDNERKVVARITAAAHEQTTSVDPEADWQRLVLVARGTHDVEVKAVFRDRVAELVTTVANTGVGILSCLVSAVVGRVQGLRVLEAESVNRRLGVRDTQEVVLVVSGRVDTGDGTVLQLNRWSTVAAVASLTTVAGSGTGHCQKAGKDGEHVG